MDEAATAPSRPRGKWQQGARILTGIELGIGVICLIMIFALVLFQAIQRYLPIDQIAWTGELSRFSLVWLMFSAMGILVTTRGHIALEIADALPPRAVRVVQTLALLIVAGFAVMMVIEAATLIESQGILKSAVMRLPMSWAYVLVLIGAVSTVLRSLVAAGHIAVSGPIYADIADDEEVPAA